MKVGTHYYTVLLASPSKISPTKFEFIRSSVEVGRKMADHYFKLRFCSCMYVCPDNLYGGGVVDPHQL